MEKGKIKVKQKNDGSFRKELKVGKNKISIPREFTFSEEYSGECDIELGENNLPLKIIINGKEIPKNDEVIEEKEKEAQKKAERELEEKKRIEEEKKKQKEKRNNASQGDNGWADSFLISETCAPSDTREIAEKSCDNFNLKFNFFARHIKESGQKKEFFFFKNDNNPKKGTGHKFKIQEDYGNTDFESLAQNQKTAAQAICKVKTQNFQPDWRLVVGLGGASVYETSMTLHHIYGFPYIPASSIKGVVRSWIVMSYFYEQKTDANKEHKDRVKEAESFAEKCEAFRNIFGTQDQRGKAIFFDAFPLSAPKIEVDVMTPHYPKWYDGTQPPTDTQSPVPIPFLTVAGTPFQFLVGSREQEIVEAKIGDKTISQWLKNALENHGIGAKTAVGYGYFN